MSAEPKPVFLNDSPRGPLLIGALAFFTLIGTIFAWSSTMSVSGAAIAPGQIAVEGNRRALQHRDGGPVAAVLVREGQRVKKNQPLIELDLTETRAEVAVLTSAKNFAVIRLARLKAEAENRDIVAWPIGIDTSDPKIQSSVQQEEQLFLARRGAYLGNVQLQKQQIQAHQRQIEGLRARIVSSRAQLATVDAELEAIRPLLSLGIVAKPRILALERAAAGFQGDLETLQGSIAAEQAAILQGQGQIAQLEKDRRESIARDQSDNESKLADTEPRLVSAKERLTRGTLLSPDDGFVYNLAVFSAGAVLVPGQVVLEIVPVDDSLVLNVEINPIDIERVRIGQEVTVHLTPYSGRWQSVLHGRLTKVSADRVDDVPKQRSYYRGVVKIDADDLKRAGVELAPGMPGDAVIQTEARTILAYFMDPIFRIYDFALREK
jgi:HlyD family type I secretion membrane fusion protein